MVSTMKKVMIDFDQEHKYPSILVAVQFEIFSVRDDGMVDILPLGYHMFLNLHNLTTIVDPIFNN
ncbi:hypothetical protein SDJN02_12368, partial [Cucurbita argyrosperma subsp. argyrosperma]